MIRFLVIVFMMSGILGCAYHTSDKEIIGVDVAEKIPNDFNRNLLIGTWYGKQALKGGGHREHIVKRFRDGTYEITFKLSVKDDIKTTVEVGQWGMSGNIYFSIFRGWVEGRNFEPSSPEVDTNYDAYFIIELNENRFVYKHARTGNEYTVLRVEDGFSFDQ